MAADPEEKPENGAEKQEGEPAKSARLPSRVEKALADARAAAKADHARKEGRWLAILPLTIGAFLLLLMMPRATAPEAVPLPRVDARALGAIERADDARAAAAEGERLPGYVLEVGSAFRAVNGLDARSADPIEKIDARRRLTGAVRDLPHASTDAALNERVESELVSLRALQTKRFLDAILRWEAGTTPAGEAEADYLELASTFLDRAREAGWVTDDESPTSGHHHLALDGRARRVVFKTVWNSVVGVDGRNAFALGLDEERALYAFYLEHPRPPETNRIALAMERELATTPEACSRAREDERRQIEMWRADKIKRLGAIDSSYPTAYALGVAYYRARRFDLSTEAFTTFIGAHPDGPLALRAKNHLKAALNGSAAY